MTDVYFTKSPFLRDPNVTDMFKTYANKVKHTSFQEDFDYVTEFVPKTRIVKFNCPVVRLMNARDQ